MHPFQQEREIASSMDGKALVISQNYPGKTISIRDASHFVFQPESNLPSLVTQGGADNFGNQGLQISRSPPMYPGHPSL